jgi:hypothetical protein
MVMSWAINELNILTLGLSILRLVEKERGDPQDAEKIIGEAIIALAELPKDQGEQPSMKKEEYGQGVQISNGL